MTQEPNIVIFPRLAWNELKTRLATRGAVIAQVERLLLKGQTSTALAVIRAARLTDKGLRHGQEEPLAQATSDTGGHGLASLFRNTSALSNRGGGKPS